MGAYLVDHPPVRSQFRSPRRAKPSGVVAIHTAENTPDYVAFDGGAEAVARFIQSRTSPGSYHELVDSDSSINLVRWTDEAFHDGTGTNPHSFGLSIATRADVWPLAPKAWRNGAIEQAAKRAAAYAKWIKTKHGITIPAHRITVDEARNRVPGFVSHAQLDPTRRTDPGQGFPWSQFLACYKALSATTKPTAPKETPMADNLIVKGQTSSQWWITDGIVKRHVNDLTEAGDLVFLGLARWAGQDQPFVVRQAMVDDLHTLSRG